jgi:hypothetical protein
MSSFITDSPALSASSIILISSLSAYVATNPAVEVPLVVPGPAKTFGGPPKYFEG